MAPHGTVSRSWCRNQVAGEVLCVASWMEDGTERSFDAEEEEMALEMQGYVGASTLDLLAMLRWVQRLQFPR